MDFYFSSTALKIKNFLIIGEATVSLANRGLLLIEGQNDDDESANSNGAGKSSLVDALCWCLFGVTARGVSGDAVINKKAKKECVVGVEVWTEDLNCYYIERGRKSKSNRQNGCFFNRRICKRAFPWVRHI